MVKQWKGSDNKKWSDLTCPGQGVLSHRMMLQTSKEKYVSHLGCGLPAWKPQCQLSPLFPAWRLWCFWGKFSKLILTEGILKQPTKQTRQNKKHLTFQVSFLPHQLVNNKKHHQQLLPFMWCLLCARHFIRHITGSPHFILGKSCRLETSSPFYIWGNGVLENLNNCSRIHSW